MNPAKGLIVEENLVGRRLDSVLAELFTEHSRSSWQKLIERGDVLLNGELTEVKAKLQPGDAITVAEREAVELSGELPILYEDDDVIVFEKPTGMLTHSKGKFNPEFTVGEYMKKFYPDDTSGRPGIVHRLDRATSGVIICAKTEEARVFLQKQFAKRNVKKTYSALIDGIPREDELIMQWPIARNPKRPHTFYVHASGKSAETYLKVLKTGTTRALVELQPKTGRTHQLRVHLSKLGKPIVGDELYDGPKADRLMLHAAKLELTLPSGERKVFKSKVPAELQANLL